jgi:hypothetical protein
MRIYLLRRQRPLQADASRVDPCRRRRRRRRRLRQCPDLGLRRRPEHRCLYILGHCHRPYRRRCRRGSRRPPAPPPAASCADQVLAIFNAPWASIDGRTAGRPPHHRAGRETVELLVLDGFLYSTIDNDHFKSTHHGIELAHEKE